MAKIPQFSAAFAVPGPLDTRTGGTIYDRRVIAELCAMGHDVWHLDILPSWPAPTPEAQADLAAKLAALPDGVPLIMDGLVLGAMDTALLASQKRPVICMLHHPLGLESGLSPERAAELIARETANLAHVAQVVVPSEHTRDILVADFGVPPARIHVGLPGFDRPVTDPSAPKPTPPLILSVGIICHRKGHDVLLDALAQITELDWQAIIAGRPLDVQVYEALLAQRARLGLEARVTFAGEVGPEALQGMFAQAHIFALATRYEGYGMVISEAQLHGLPVVSCAVGAVPMTAPPDTAILTQPDDPAAFAVALRKVLGDSARHAALAQGARALAASLPTWRDTAQVMAQAVNAARL